MNDTDPTTSDTWQRPFREHIDAALIDALDSGESTPTTSEDWDDIRREGREQIASRK